ncbi:hypothetical protein FLA_0695 [Filimonas lacunae]|nr:hypothetical protein FLA_0695 [Filimonas lacunae]
MNGYIQFARSVFVTGFLMSAALEFHDLLLLVLATVNRQ